MNCFFVVDTEVVYIAVAVGSLAVGIVVDTPAEDTADTDSGCIVEDKVVDILVVDSYLAVDTAVGIVAGTLVEGIAGIGFGCTVDSDSGFGCFQLDHLLETVQD